jgi:hypothetical protein
MKVVTIGAAWSYLMDHSLPPLIRKVDVKISICWVKSEYLDIIDMNDLMWFGRIKGFRLFIDVLDLAFLDFDYHAVGC